MQRVATTFAICFFGLLALRASAQPMPESQPIQPEENRIIPAVKWRTGMRTSSPGRVHIDEDTVYILNAVHRAYKDGKVCEERDFRGERLPGTSTVDPDSSGIDWRLESELCALANENGASKWSFEAEEGVSDGWVSTSMMSAGDFVYFHVGDTLHALSRDLGREKWTFQAAQSKRTFPLLSWTAGICVFAVIVVVIGRFLRLWTRTKTVVLVVALLIMVIGVALGLTALFQTPSRYAASLQVANGSVYFRSSNDLLHDLAGDTGQLRWRFHIVPSLNERFSSVLRNIGVNVPSPPAPVISDGVIIVQDDIRRGGSRLVACDVKTRKTLWTSEARVITGEAPIAASGTVYAATSDRVVALAADTGTLKWQSDQIKTSDHVVPRDRVVAYVRGWDDKSRWQTAQFRARASNPPHLLAFECDSLYVLAAAYGDLQLIDGDRDSGSTHDRVYVNHILALSASTGKVRWKGHVGVNIARPTVQDNTVYFVSQDRLFALEVGTGKIRWQWQCPRNLVPGNNASRYTPTSIGDYAVAADGTAYVLTGNGVFALDPNTPKEPFSLPDLKGKVVLLNF
jgi:outer membrane protein assembly factor BamB